MEQPVWCAKSAPQDTDLTRYGTLDGTQFCELELRMYTLIKSGKASMFELEEYYTLPEALKLYALLQMDMDIQNARIREAEEQRR